MACILIVDFPNTEAPFQSSLYAVYTPVQRLSTWHQRITSACRHIVIFYHFGFSGVSRGFVGVNVIFVISGYLMIQILGNEFDKPFFRRFYFAWAKRTCPHCSWGSLWLSLRVGGYWSQVKKQGYRYMLVPACSLFRISHTRKRFGILFLRRTPNGFPMHCICQSSSSFTC